MIVYFCYYQLICGGSCGVEKGIVYLDFFDVLQVWFIVFEQVGGLVIDFKWVDIVQQV